MIEAFYSALDYVDSIPPVTLDQWLICVLPMWAGFALLCWALWPHRP